MIAVIAIALGVVIYRYLAMGESWSLHDPSMVVGIVFGIGCLIYATAPMLIWFAAAAVFWFLSREAQQMKRWQDLVPWILLGFGWIALSIHQNDQLILKGLDALHDKVDALQAKIDDMESGLND